MHYWYKLYFVSKLVHVFSCKQQNQYKSSRGVVCKKQSEKEYLGSQKNRLHDPEESFYIISKNWSSEDILQSTMLQFLSLKPGQLILPLAPSSLCLDGASIAQQMDSEQSLLLHTSCFQVKVWSCGTRWPKPGSCTSCFSFGRIWEISYVAWGASFDRRLGIP